MSGCDIIVVGASAGGVEALRHLVAGLPADLPASVFIVQHLPGEFHNALPQILERVGSLPAAFATDRAKITRGRIYMAPPDQHMLVLDGTVRLSRGPWEHSSRPAVDP